MPKPSPDAAGIGGSHGDDSFETSWNILSESLQEIHTKNASGLSYEKIYRHAYKLVLKNQGDRLHSSLKAFIQTWLEQNVRETITSVIPSQLLRLDGTLSGNPNERRVASERLMKALKDAWEDHNLCMSMTTDVLMYMDRIYCKSKELPPLFVTAMLIFRDNILRWYNETDSAHDYVTVENLLHTIVLDQIGMEREGEVINKSLVRSCVYLMEGLYESENEALDEKIYLTAFEPKFVSTSREYYRANARSTLDNSDSITYLKHVQKCLDDEAGRCKTTVSDMSSRKIEMVIEAELITRHLDEVVQLEGSGVKSMIENDRDEDLLLLYKLSARVDDKKVSLTKALQRQIGHMGKTVNDTAMDAILGNRSIQGVTDANPSKIGSKGATAAAAGTVATAAALQWVEEVIQLKEKFDKISEVSFCADQRLSAQITKSFSEFINLLDRSPEFISLFIDDNLKRGLKGKTEAEVDVVLDQAITLIRYLNDKDKFELYYKKHLARRLLMKRSISTEIELQILSRMKQELGHNVTQKLEGMFRDMATSDDMTLAYHNHSSSLVSDSKRTELVITVLTSTFWPSENDSSVSKTAQLSCNYPTQISRLKSSFEKFYLDKHTGRKLTWKGNGGSADMRLTFPKDPSAKQDSKLGKDRRYEANVPTYSMVILMLFNDAEPGRSLTYAEIQAETALCDSELTRNLIGLALTKYRILRKEPMSKKIEPSDRFSVNDSFTSPYLKFKVGAVASGSKVESDHERVETEKKNNEMRDLLIETVVVKIMKERRKSTHLDLINEIITQLSTRFSPDVSRIKTRIESLIDREFLKRDEKSNVPAYSYVA
ncbi:MAG: Cullin-3 [Vezdaea aestivalis]|nr:MAG: Cullin-3 [Vezdaea aestivalis]